MSDAALDSSEFPDAPTDLHMRIGSDTKAFVITGILRLADQGRLHFANFS